MLCHTILRTVVYITSKQSICCWEESETGWGTCTLVLRSPETKEDFNESPTWTEGHWDSTVGHCGKTSKCPAETLWTTLTFHCFPLHPLPWVIQIAVTGTAVRIDMPYGSKYIHASRWAPQELSDWCNGAISNCAGNKEMTGKKINHPQVVNVETGQRHLKAN
jgi:hypothetical protein